MAKQQWALVTGDSITTSIENSFGDYSLDVSPGDLLVGTFFFLPKSLFTFLFILSCNRYFPHTVLLCATHVLRTVVTL